MLALLLACAPKVQPPPVEAVRGELVEEGPLPARLSDVAADLVILYGGEQKGSMDTCGCPKRPRGSLPRMSAYVQALSRKEPVILVNPGYWLEDPTDFQKNVRPDITTMDTWMLQGLNMLPWTALNAGAIDLAAMAVIKDDPNLKKLPIISANAEDQVPYVIVQKNNVNVGIVGISGQTPTMGDYPWKLHSPSDAHTAIEELSRKTDLIVLLSWEATEDAKKLAESMPEIDVVIDANHYQDFMPPVIVGSAVWAYSHVQTMRLGELRLDLDGGKVVGALDRKIDMDPTMPEDPDLAGVLKRAKAEVNAQQDQQFH